VFTSEAQGDYAEPQKARTEKGKSVDLKNKDAVDAIVAKISSSKKGLSYKEVKKIIAASLGVQRIHASKLEPILELGFSTNMFSVKDSRLVACKLDHHKISGFYRMSADAQKYYDKAVKISTTYINQAELYVDYCTACAEEGKDPVSPEQWVCGDE